MSLEDTFKSYVQNITNPGAANPAAFIPPPNTGLPRHFQNPVAVQMATPSSKPSIWKSVWAWCKKWLGLVVFLLVVGIAAIIIWKRTAPGPALPPNRPVFDGQPCLPTNDIENEYEDPLLSTTDPVYSEDHQDIPAQYDEDEEEVRGGGGNNYGHHQCGLESIEEIDDMDKKVVGEEEADDFDKLVQESLKKKEEATNSRPVVMRQQTTAASAPAAENDFDTLEDLDNA